MIILAVHHARASFPRYVSTTAVVRYIYIYLKIICLDLEGGSYTAVPTAYILPVQPIYPCFSEFGCSDAAGATWSRSSCHAPGTKYMNRSERILYRYVGRIYSDLNNQKMISRFTNNSYIRIVHINTDTSCSTLIQKNYVPISITPGLPVYILKRL